MEVATTLLALKGSGSQLNVTMYLQTRRVPDECSKDVADLIQRCCITCPAERPSATDIMRFLEQHLSRDSSPKSGSMLVSNSPFSTSVSKHVMRLVQGECKVDQVGPGMRDGKSHSIDGPRKASTGSWRNVGEWVGTTSQLFQHFKELYSDVNVTFPHD
jgi:hypothetical protein